MSFHSLVQGFWSAGLVLQSLLAATLIAKKAWRNFPVFMCYALGNLLESAVSYALASNGELYFYAYVVGETITVALGLAVVFEIYKHLFAPYPGLRRVSSVSLCGAMALLVLLAGAVLYTNAPIGKSDI